jgi:hypothetical protein
MIRLHSEQFIKSIKLHKRLHSGNLIEFMNRELLRIMRTDAYNFGSLSSLLQSRISRYFYDSVRRPIGRAARLMTQRQVNESRNAYTNQDTA